MHDPLKSTEKASPPLFGFTGGDILPERFGPYQIIDKVSESLGIVYKARQASPERTVALKIPCGGKLLTRDDLAAFEKEIAVAARLDHSAIVPVLETGVIDGTPYYTMPFIEGRDLYSEVVVGALDWPARLALFKKVCRAVQGLHDHRLIHRDLKPNNILVDRHRDIRLLDFGLAKALESPTRQQGRIQIAGTLPFMAPEQTLGQDSQLSPACDVYALGVMLYWMACNKAPYVLPADHVIALQMIREQRIIPPQETGASIAPPEYDAVICACLNKNPALRPHDAEQLLLTLGRVEKSAQNVSGPTTSTTSTAAETMAMDPPRTNPSNWAPLLLIAGALLLLGSGALLALRHPAPPSGQPAMMPSPSQQILSIVINNDAELDITNPPTSRLDSHDATVPPAITSTVAWAMHDLVGASFTDLRNATLSLLQNDFAMRDHGALLITLENTGVLTIRGHQAADVTEIRGRPGHVVAVFLLAGKPYTWQWVTPSTRRSGNWNLGPQSIDRLTLP